MSSSLELGQYSIQKLKFTGRSPDEIVSSSSRIHLIFNRFEHKGVVAEFPKLHQHITEITHAGFPSLAIPDNHLIMGEKLFVQLSLQSRKAALNNALLLVRQIFLDIFLETSQQEWSKNLVKTTNDEQLLFFCQLHAVLSSSVGERSVKPFIERLDRL